MNHKKSHKALIFNIFYLIFVVLTIAAGVLLGNESNVMSFLNSTLKLPESYGPVNGWSLLSVVLFVVLLYALLIEQKEKKHMVFGTIFFFALIAESGNLSNQVTKPCLLNETRIRSAPPSSFTRKLQRWNLSQKQT